MAAASLVRLSSLSCGAGDRRLSSRRYCWNQKSCLKIAASSSERLSQFAAEKLTPKVITGTIDFHTLLLVEFQF